MTLPEMGYQSRDHLKPDFVEELINPEIAYRPYGAEEPLSEYLYRPMTMTGSSKTMIDFLDVAEDFINKNDFDSASNHLKIDRILALFADMPDSLPVEERLDAWKKLLEADWLIANSHIYSLESTLRRGFDTQPDLFKAVIETLPIVIGSNIQVIKDEVVEDEDLALEQDNIGFEHAIKLTDIFRDGPLHMRMKVDSSVVLSSAYRALRHVISER